MKLYIFKLLFFLIFFVSLGLFREYVFVNINNIIYFKYYKSTTFPIPFIFNWLTYFSYSTLYYLKYPLTILFVLIYLISNIYFLKTAIIDKTKFLFYYKILIAAYIVIFVISAILMSYLFITNQKLNDDEYHISRGLMGLAQSPLISFVLFAVYLWDKNKLQIHEEGNNNI
jgi:hypothetical protein